MIESKSLCFTLIFLPHTDLTDLTKASRFALAVGLPPSVFIRTATASTSCDAVIFVRLPLAPSGGEHVSWDLCENIHGYEIKWILSLKISDEPFLPHADGAECRRVALTSSVLTIRMATLAKRVCLCESLRSLRENQIFSVRKRFACRCVYVCVCGAHCKPPRVSQNAARRFL